MSDQQDDNEESLEWQTFTVEELAEGLLDQLKEVRSKLKDERDRLRQKMDNSSKEDEDGKMEDN